MREGQNVTCEKLSRMAIMLSLAGIMLLSLWSCGGGASQESPNDMEPPPLAACQTVTPDVEFRCPYHPIDGSKHNMTFTSLVDGSVRLADGNDTVSPNSDLLFDPLQPLGWATILSVISPSLDRALTAKQKVDCSRGTECLIKLWYVFHEQNDISRIDDDEWVHVNLSALGLDEPYEAHGWSTWLHNDLVLFNAQGAPIGSGSGSQFEDNMTQIYALRLDGAPRVERFAAGMLEDQNCLTGRVNAQPPREANSCFDGQRVSFVRRCEYEPVSSTTRALWNSKFLDDPSSGTCVAGGQAQVPVLRTYVMEVDENCQPKQTFSEMVPVHVPASEPENRSMGIVPEWGEMLSAISADGKYVALGVNRVDSSLLASMDCPGFRHNVTDPNDELSGNATRHTHVCELGDTLQCVAEPIPVPTESSPMEDLTVPGFVANPLIGDQSLIINRVFAPFGEPRIVDVVRGDLFNGQLTLTPFQFGPATGATPIHPTNPP